MRKVLLLFFALILISVSVNALFLDGFEDNDYTNNPTWTASGTIAVQDLNVKNGTYALRAGAGAESLAETTLQNMNCSEIYDFNAWIFISKKTETYKFYLLDASDNIVAGFGATDSNFSGYTNGVYSKFNTPIDVNKWYNQKISFGTNPLRATYSLYDANGVLLERKINLPLTNYNFPTKMQIGSGATGLSFWDDVSYGAECNPDPWRTASIKIPKNEKTLANITPFTLLVNGVGVTVNNYTNLSIDTNIYWAASIGNIITVDVNANNGANGIFFTRRYSIDSNALATTIQPYLVSTTTGYQASIFVQDSLSQVGVPNVYVASYKSIAGVLTKMEERVTDSVGNVQMSFVEDETYTITLTKDGVLLATETINADLTTYYFAVGLTIIVPPTINFPTLDVNILPGGSIIYQNDTNFLDFNESIRIHGATISSIDTNFWFKDLNIYSNTNSSISTAGNLYQDINALKILYDYNGGVGFIKMVLKVSLTDGNVLYFYKTYTFISYSTPYNFWNVLSIEIPSMFGETNSETKPTLLFFALTIALFTSFGMTKFIKIGWSGAGIFVCIIMWIFVWVGWVDPIIATTMSLIVGAFALYSFSRGG